MSEHSSHQSPPARPPASIGLFWFVALVAATGFWTGAVRIDSLPEFTSGFTTQADVPATGESRSLLPNLFETSIPDTTAANIVSIQPVNEHLGTPGPIPVGTVADSAIDHEAPLIESHIPAADQSGPQLSLSVTAPDSAAVDEAVMVWVNLRNTTETLAKDITVICGFDDRFEFPGSRDGIVRQRLGSLAPGDSQGMALPLTAQRAGRGHLQLRVSSRTHADTTAERSLDIRGPQATSVPQSAAVDVNIVGPGRRTVGSRAEYVITLVNAAGADLPSARVTLSHDAALQLKEVSAGAERHTRLLRWDLGTLRENERIQIQVEFECASSVPAATLSVAVTSNDQSVGAAESRLEVAARRDLDVQLSDTADPLELEQQSTFLLSVVNHASEPVRDVVIHLVPSRNITITGARVRHGSDELGLNAFVEGNRLYFEAAPPLERGSTLSYEIEFQANAPGAGELRALVQSPSPAVPLEVREPLVINSPVSDG